MHIILNILTIAFTIAMVALATLAVIQLISVLSFRYTFGDWPWSKR